VEGDRQGVRIRKGPLRRVGTGRHPVGRLGTMTGHPNPSNGKGTCRKRTRPSTSLHTPLQMPAMRIRRRAVDEIFAPDRSLNR
jgi:hypothetical protein